MNRKIKPFGLRMPPDLKAKIKQAARDSYRSMNKEIVRRLEQSFDGDITHKKTERHQ